MSELTKTGNLPTHVAAAACYVPFFSVNLLASVGFLLLEPPEHTDVRFHAVQSLILQAIWIGATFLLTIATIGWMVVLGGLLDFISMFDAGLIPAFATLGFGVQILLVLALFLVVLGGVVGFLGMAGMAAMQRAPEVPVVVRYANRFAGRELTP